MSIWSNNTINRFAQEGENYIAREYNCILDRLSLNIRTGIAIYTLPEYVFGIRRVAWKGKKIEPWSFWLYPHLNLANLSILTPGAFQQNFVQNNAFQVGGSSLETPQAEPYTYIYSGFGQNTIRFYPSPNEIITSITTNLYGSEIPNRVIVEFYRLCDFTSNTLRVPEYMRRHLIKNYVLWKCFSQEGKGQNLKGASYFKTKFENSLSMFKVILNGIYIAKPNTQRIVGDHVSPARPVLPISKFGIMVGDD